MPSYRRIRRVEVEGEEPIYTTSELPVLDPNTNYNNPFHNYTPFPNNIPHPQVRVYGPDAPFEFPPTTHINHKQTKNKPKKMPPPKKKSAAFKGSVAKKNTQIYDARQGELLRDMTPADVGQMRR